MRKGIYFLTAFFFVFQIHVSYGQCTPNSNLNYPGGWGIIPDSNTSLPVAVVGEFYSQTFYFKMPDEYEDVEPDCSWLLCGWDIEDVTLNSMSGLPSGLSYACNVSNCTWDGGEYGCVVVSGIPTQPTLNPLGNKVRINLTGYIRNVTGEHSGDFTMTGYRIKVDPAPCFLTASVVTTNETQTGAGNGQAIVTASGGTQPYTYRWSNGSTQNQAIGLVVGEHSVTVTDARDCEFEASFTIESDGDPANPCAGFNVVLSPQPETTQGTLDGAIQSNVSGGTAPFSYLWSSGQTTSSISGLSAGSYRLTVTDANNCTKAKAVIVGLLNDTTTEDTTVINPCSNFSVSIVDVQNENAFQTADGRASVSITGGTTPHTITWSNGASTPLNENLSAGTYWVYVTDANQCNDADTVSIILEDSSYFFCNLNIYFIKTNETAPFAEDGAVSVSANSGIAPYSYLWSTGSTQNSLSNLGPAIYYITVIDDLGCEGVDSVKIFEFGDTTCALNISMNTIPESAPGRSDGVASALANGGQPPYDYVWNNGAAQSTIYNLATANYIVTITDANLCAVSKLVTVMTGPISVNEIQEFENHILVYPNPVSRIVTIEFLPTTTESFNHIELYSISGIKVIEIPVLANANKLEVDLKAKALASGLYMLKINSEERAYYKKLIVE